MEEENITKKRPGVEIKQTTNTKKSKTSGDFPVPPRNSNAVFNQNIFLPNEVEKIKTTYQNETPFQHVEISNILTPDFVAEVQQVFPKANWTKKKNDLYTFQQSQDLASFSEGPLGSLRLGLYSKEFRQYLTTITGIELNTTVDISASWYQKGDTLLCHDDELDGRRIAFIIYFVESEWTKEDGGSLDLFQCNSQNDPIAIAKSIIPTLNSMVIFAPSLTSWHQVSEVTSQKNRYAISGWFHGEPLPRKVATKEPVQIDIEEFENCDLSEFINPEYLQENAIQRLKKHFQKNSSVGLNDFLIKSKYEEISQLLEASQSWDLFVPYQRRCYYSLGRWGQEKETGELLRFKKFFLSKGFIGFLESIISLKILSGKRGEFRKFERSNYSMVHDYESQMDEECIDIQFGIQDEPHWSLSRGGFTSYMDENEEILTLIPLKNTLSVVFRDKGCMRFVKYVPSHNLEKRFDFVTSFVPLITDSEGSQESEEEENSSENDSSEGIEIEGEEIDDDEDAEDENSDDDIR